MTIAFYSGFVLGWMSCVISLLLLARQRGLW